MFLCLSQCMMKCTAEQWVSPAFFGEQEELQKWSACLIHSFYRLTLEFWILSVNFNFETTTTIKYAVHNIVIRPVNFSCDRILFCWFLDWHKVVDTDVHIIPWLAACGHWCAPPRDTPCDKRTFSNRSKPVFPELFSGGTRFASRRTMDKPMSHLGDDQVPFPSDICGSIAIGLKMATVWRLGLQLGQKSNTLAWNFPRDAIFRFCLVLIVQLNAFLCSA